MSLRPLMILGTSSHVGKSIVTAAFGRIFSDDGLRVAPFKAQNMSLNSAATPDGKEIGRAQALQAEACRTIAQAEMNPVLIKPSTHTSSQVVVLGRVWDQIEAADYYRNRVETLFPIVLDSFRKLANANDLVLLEGAGSPAEINLKSRDIVNMRMAQAAGAACVLVGDIDRGGVFASLLGTLELLEPEERIHIRAFLINKFRGDVSLLIPGIQMMEKRLGIPCAGVIPYLSNLGLDEEDSVELELRPTAQRWTRESAADEDRPLRIGVIALPHLANFTDFDALQAEPCVSLAYLRAPEELQAADMVIVPGSKQTFDDLDWLAETGFTQALLHWYAVSERRVLAGICGGLQMLGTTLEDSAGLESGSPRKGTGLSLLAIHTQLTNEKVTRRAAGVLSADFLEMQDCALTGYEIHLGETMYLPGALPFGSITREGDSIAIPDGAVADNGKVFGTYLHGLLDNDAFRHRLLGSLRRRCGLAAAQRYAPVSAERDGRIDRLANHVRQAVDMEMIYRFLR